MSALRAIRNEFLGLFVDDGALALLLVLWCVAVGTLVALAHPQPLTAGLLLTAGCIAALLSSVARAARRGNT
jgi:hypothetical protein